MLTIVKLALRISGNSFDSEIQMLIDDCIAELLMLGISFDVSTENSTTIITDAQIKSTIVAYCKWKFGQNDMADKWKVIYEDKVSKLKIANDYRPSEA